MNVSNQARSLADRSGNSILHSEAISMVLKGEQTDIISDDELIELTNLTQKQYSSTIIDKSYCQSIDTPLTDDEKTTVEDTLTEEIHPFRDSFTKDSINQSLKVLNPREYKVISEYYGLDGKEERTIKEIAKELELGDERIRQIRKGAIKKLEKRCGKTLKTLL
jgi:RNA polymerase sigma factor (sigma-70 family)